MADKVPTNEANGLTFTGIKYYGPVNPKCLKKSLKRLNHEYGFISNDVGQKLLRFIADFSINEYRTKST